MMSEWYFPQFEFKTNLRRISFFYRPGKTQMSLLNVKAFYENIDFNRKCTFRDPENADNDFIAFDDISVRYIGYPLRISGCERPMTWRPHKIYSIYRACGHRLHAWHEHFLGIIRYRFIQWSILAPARIVIQLSSDCRPSNRSYFLSCRGMYLSHLRPH